MFNNIIGFTIIIVLCSLPSSELLASQDVEPWPDADFFSSVPIASNDSIRKRIVRETTGLAVALEKKEDLKIIRLLRGWAADNMDINGGGTSYWLKLEKSNRTLGNMLYLFDHNLLGVQCGDGSRFLQKIYKLFGYETILYDSGVHFRSAELKELNEGYTHVITLVRITHRDKQLWIAEDVLFDTEYRIPGEEASDFADVLILIGSNPSTLIDRPNDQTLFNRESLSISEKAAKSAKRFEQFATKIHVKSGPDHFKPNWETWIKQDSSSAQIIRELLNFDGYVYPYHLFRFPIYQSQPIPGIHNLLSVENQYSIKSKASPGTLVSLGKRTPSDQSRQLPDAAFFASVKVSSDDSIRKRIVRETTGLAAALAKKEDLKIIRLLRGWAADNMDVNRGGTSYWLKLEKSNRTLGNMLYLFDHNLLGVQCGDGSRFLKKIYNLFGYESLLYNSGVYFQDPAYAHLNEGMTHVITLVKIRNQEKDLWIPQDILFDAEYRLPGEKASNFADIISQIGSNPQRRIERVQNQTIFDRDRLFISKRAADTAHQFEDFAKKIQVKSGPDRYKTGWNTWFKQESRSAHLLRELLNFEGRVYPYHLFWFPIGDGRQIPGVYSLQSFEDTYMEKLPSSLKTVMALEK